MPTGHSKQVAAAAKGLYVPASHGTQKPIDKIVPAAHTPGEERPTAPHTDPPALNPTALLAGQGIGKLKPDVGQKLPEGHGKLNDKPIPGQ